MNFTAFLSRFDDELIQDLVGLPALRLMRLLDPDLVNRSRLLDLVLRLHPPESLLIEAEFRGLLFDLLSPHEARNLALILGLDPDERLPYETLKHVKIRRGSDKERALFEFFSLLPPTTESPSPIVGQSRAEANYGLFKHQRIAARRLQQKLTRYPRRVVLHMPTGSGKTRTTMHVISEHLREHEPTVVVWLAYSEELCNQAMEEFERAWHFLGNRELDTYRFWSDSDLLIENVRDGFLVAGLAKTYSALKRSTHFITELGRKCSLVIIDEAHSAIAETYSLILDALFVQRQSTSLLGLTATPGRTWSDIDVDEELAKFFNRQKVTLQVDGYENPVDYLIDEGYLARANFESLFYGGGNELSPADMQRVKDALDIPYHILRRLAEDEQRNLQIIMRIEELAKVHKRILVFATTVEHSDLLAAILSARGLQANSITAQTASSERWQFIERFRHRTEEVRILCNYGVLTTGFDAPQTSAALIARPTKSLVLYSQMVGRAIRGRKAGGNDEALIITVVDQNLPGFGSVADAFANWEDIWE